MRNKSLLLEINSTYLPKVLQYHGVDYKENGSALPYINGFREYNYLIDINSIFSTKPSGDIIDRTGQIKLPFKFHIARPWIVPGKVTKTFEQCLTHRVQQLIDNNKKINLFWSGGIDSTTVLVAFLKNCKNLSQLRVLYSTLSIKENSNMFLMLASMSELELVDFSGDVYLQQNYDGVFVTGDPADDLTASLDLSFYQEHGYVGCNDSWENVFYKKTNNTEFIDFCQQHFSHSGREIRSLLEARWWFYVNSKIQKFPSQASHILQPHQPLVVGFFDFYDFEHYMFWNTDNILPTPDYSSYKNEFKKYIFEYDRNKEYLKHKTKFNSNQLSKYKAKKLALLNQSFLMLLEDGTRISTDNLPFFSEKEYREKYKNNLDYLFDV